MVNPEQPTRLLSDLCKHVMTRKWLNMAPWQSKIIYGLCLQSSLTLAKFMANLKPCLVKEQIRHKLIAFEGEAKCSKIKSVMKWWSKCISMAIAKTASRNVAFKVAKMRDSIMEDQDELIMRKSECEELSLEANTKAVLED